MRKKCAKCGVPILSKRCHCAKCRALATKEQTFEVRLELTLDELHTVTCVLADRAAELRYHRGADLLAAAKTLEKVAQAFRDAPEDERRREADEAHCAWMNAEARSDHT